MDKNSFTFPQKPVFSLQTKTLFKNKTKKKKANSQGSPKDPVLNTSQRRAAIPPVEIRGRGPDTGRNVRRKRDLQLFCFGHMATLSWRLVSTVEAEICGSYCTRPHLNTVAPQRDRSELNSS